MNQNSARRKVRILFVLLSSVVLTWQVLSQESLPALAKKVRSAVVTVIAYNEKGMVLQTGSGFFINKQGHLVTNLHVLQGASEAEVKTQEGRNYPVKTVLAEDKMGDLVTFSIDPHNSEVASLNISNVNPEVGEHIVVVGSPLGLAQTVSEGIVSAVREIQGFGKILQITAAISPGSSGSPVVNPKGEVVGIAALQMLEGQNLNFAIPGERILRLQPTMAKTLSEMAVEATKEALVKIAADVGQPVPMRPGTNTDMILDRGIRYAWQKDCEKALPYLVSVLTKSPEIGPAWFWLCTSYMNLGRPDPASEACREAVRVKPEYATDKGARQEYQIVANENSAVASMRTIGSGCLLFCSTNGEFPPSLAVLGREPFDNDQGGTSIISAELASGTKSGYRFSYVRNNRWLAFSVNADPLIPGETGRRSFFMNEAQRIYYNINAPAGPSSSLFSEH